MIFLYKSLREKIHVHALGGELGNGRILDSPVLEGDKIRIPDECGIQSELIHQFKTKPIERRCPVEIKIPGLKVFPQEMPGKILVYLEIQFCNN